MRLSVFPKPKEFLMTSFMCLSALLSEMAWSKCTLDGKPMATIHDESEKLSRTGVLICVDDKTNRRIMEEEYKDGALVRKVGFFATGDYSDMQMKDGEYHGSANTYYASGKLQEAATYQKGYPEGEVKEYDEGGNLRRISFWRKKQFVSSLTYNESGQISDVDCPQRDPSPTFKKLCGFLNTNKMTLYDGHGKTKRILWWKNGRIIRKSLFSPDGRSLKEAGSDDSVSWSVTDERKKQRKLYSLRQSVVSIAGDRINETLFDEQDRPIFIRTWENSELREIREYSNGGLKREAEQSEEVFTVRDLGKDGSVEKIWLGRVLFYQQPNLGSHDAVWAPNVVFDEIKKSVR